MNIIIGLIEHLGDIVACEPVTRYLRHKHPDAHISWAVREPFRDIIDTNPNVNETIVFDCLTDWIKLCSHNRKDVIVDLHVNYRICEDCRVPLIKRHGNPFVNVFEYFDYGAILESFSQGAGLPKLSAPPQVYINDQHTAAVDRLGLPAQFCVVHRESNSALKEWPAEKWQSVLQFVETELKLPIVEIGAKQKNAPATTRTGVIDLLGKTTILETAEVIRRAKLYIGIDSGPAHLANAVKTPGVILLGRIGVFRQYSPFTGFYASSSPQVRLVRNLTGPVAEIPADEVLEAVRYIDRVGIGSGSSATHIQVPQLSTSTGNGHYRHLVLDSGFFDRAWYVTHYPETLESGMDPLDHFVTVGGAADYSPGPNFDSAWYRTQRPDLKAAPIHCLEHYLQWGVKEGLRPVPTAGAVTVPETPPRVEEIVTVLEDNSTERAVLSYPETPDESLPRIFAFYLPQFHPIAENNFGHRPGFTEWDNVIKAKPLFKGHYQPRIPGELGYYDLRSLEVMREQTRLANQYGINGFCFYYYYFQGKKLLYTPIRNYIESDIKAPFFFLWANENWSRRWDGGDDEIIISQKHSREDDLAFIRELLPTFEDPRYVKVHGKPILGIYRAHLFPDIKRSIDTWRDEVEKHGFPGLYLFTVDDWTADPGRPRELGFDASYEIPSNIVHSHMLVGDMQDAGLEDGFRGRIVDYRKFASFHMGRPFPQYTRFRTVMAPWDNTPRYASRAMVHINTDNDAYKLWLTQALIDTHVRQSPDERIVFLHSWNEWCEGTYVEPDGRTGRRLLEETKEAVDDMRRVASLSQTAETQQSIAQLLRLLREKDEGAARSLQAMRQQTWYLYRDLERERSRASQSEATLHGVLNSRSWRLTQALRNLKRIVKKT